MLFNSLDSKIHAAHADFVQLHYFAQTLSFLQKINFKIHLLCMKQILHSSWL